MNFIRNVKSFKTIAPDMWAMRKHLTIGLILLTMVNALQLVIPKIIKWAIDSMTSGEATKHDLIMYAFYILAIALFISYFRYYSLCLLYGGSHKLIERLRNKIFTHLQLLSFTYFNNTKTGDLMAHMTNDVNAIRIAIGSGLIVIVDMIFLSIFSLIIMLNISVKLTIFILLPMPFLTLLLLFFSKILHDLFEKVQENFAHITDNVNETLSGMRVVKAYLQEEGELNKFRKINNDYVANNLKSIRIWGVFDPIIDLLVGLSLMIILWFGGGQVMYTEITLGDFVSVFSYTHLLIGPMLTIGWIVNIVQRAAASMKRINKILNIVPEITDMDVLEDIDKLNGNIEIRNLTFTYAPDLENFIELVKIAANDNNEKDIDKLILLIKTVNSHLPIEDLKRLKEEFEIEDLGKFASNLKEKLTYEKEKTIKLLLRDGFIQLIQNCPNLPPVLKNINLKINAGETIAIVGRTGSGKSTLINLLLRLYEVPDNTIFIDDIEIHRIPLRILRDSFGMVPQDTFLFSDTIHKNIAFSNPNIDKEKTEEAAHIAQIHKEIMEFPDGYDTMVGERGVTLSGGQKQRIAIARSIISKPPIMILDDSLSAVDTHTEESILRQLKEILENCTSIIISHRISTIQNADQIILIDDGEIAEQGNHKELLILDGIYADLYRRQQLEEEIEEEIKEDYDTNLYQTVEA